MDEKTITHAANYVKEDLKTMFKKKITSFDITLKQLIQCKLSQVFFFHDAHQVSNKGHSILTMY